MVPPLDDQLKPQMTMNRLKALARRLWSPVLFAYAISGAVALASFLSTMLLARLAGAAVIGQYALAVSTASMLASFAMLGLDRILIREIAGDLREGDSGRASAALRAITRAVAATAIIATTLYSALVVLTPLVDHIGGDMGAMLIVGVSALAWPMLRVGYSAVRAAGMPVAGQFLEALPTFLFLAGVVLFVLAGTTPDAATATGVAAAGQLVAAILAWLLLRPHRRQWGAPVPGSLDQRMLVAGLPLMASLFLQLFSDWLLLARLSAVMGASETGAFRVSVQIVTIISILVATTESYVAARIAGDFRAGRPDLAWKRHYRATLVMLGLTAPVFLLLFAAPEPLLGIAFGPEFRIAATALTIMAAGQLVNVARGPLGSLLTMSGNERVQLSTTIGGVILVVILAWALVPRYGLAGAAIAQAAPFVFRSVAGYLIARHRIPRHIN